MNLKLGIIGCGWLAENVYLHLLSENKYFQVISIFDTDEQKLQKISSQFPIKNLYTNIDDFFSSGIDCVIIASPNYTHVKYTHLSILNNKHVLCEKPISFDSQSVYEATEKAKASGVIYLPAFVNRFRRDIQLVTNELKDANIGAIRRIDGKWIRKDGVPRPGSWFTNRAYSGGGVLMDLGSHVLDICSSFIPGEKPITANLNIEAGLNKIESSKAEWYKSDVFDNNEIDVEHSVNADIAFTNDINVNVELSWCKDVQGDSTSFTIHGTKKVVELNTLFGFSQNRLFEQTNISVNELDGTKKNIPLNNGKDEAYWAFNEMLTYFYQCIHTNKYYFLSPHDGFNNVKLIEMLYNSVKINQS
jgi:predicted dehydrogenase